MFQPETLSDTAQATTNATYSLERTRPAMRVPPIEIIDPTVLPRRADDAGYEPGLVSDYYEVRRGYQVVRRAGSLTSYLMYTVSGHGYFRDRQNRVLRVSRGDFVLIEAKRYQEYGIWPESSRWHAHWVHFDAQSHWTHWLPLPLPSGLRDVSYAHVSTRSLQRQVSELFFDLQAQRTRPETWRHALSLHLLERILILARGTSSMSRPVDPRIRKVLRAIEASSPRAPRSSELAAVAGLSPSRLGYLFKQQVGTSMLAAVNRVRLRAAQLALEEVGVTLAEAAERAGFLSPYSFSNWFHAQTGQRPGAYRRALAQPRRAQRPDEPWILTRDKPRP
jgi:AraC family transcriptional regulator, arabinose operon regulatory protein